MNFSPDTSNYIEMLDSIEAAQSHLDDISRVDFSIDCEEDISSDLNSLSKDVLKNQEKAAQYIIQSLATLKSIVASAFEKSLDSYSDLADSFLSNNLHETFADNIDDFPFDEWFELKQLKINFSDVKRFFSNMPKSSDADLEIYFSNAKKMFTAIEKNTPGDGALFFSEFVTLISPIKEEKRDQFINDMFDKNNKYKASFFINHINSKLKKEYIDSPFVSQAKEALILQCSYEKGKEDFVNFILNDKSNQQIYCNKDYQGRSVKKINWDNLEKLVEIDYENNLNVMNLMSSKIIEIVSKNLNTPEENHKCQEFLSLSMSYSLEKKLTHKTKEETNKIKI